MVLKTISPSCWVRASLMLFLQLLNVLRGDRKLSAGSLESLNIYPALPHKLTDFVFFWLYLIYYCIYAMFISLFVCVQMVYLQMHLMFFSIALLYAQILPFFFKYVHMYFPFIEHSYMLEDS